MPRAPCPGSVLRAPYGAAVQRSAVQRSAVQCGAHDDVSRNGGHHIEINTIFNSFGRLPGNVRSFFQRIEIEISETYLSRPTTMRRFDVQLAIIPAPYATICNHMQPYGI